MEKLAKNLNRNQIYHQKFHEVYLQVLNFHLHFKSSKQIYQLNKENHPGPVAVSDPTSPVHEPATNSTGINQEYHRRRMTEEEAIKELG